MSLLQSRTTPLHQCVPAYISFLPCLSHSASLDRYVVVYTVTPTYAHVGECTVSTRKRLTAVTSAETRETFLEVVSSSSVSPSWHFFNYCRDSTQWHTAGYHLVIRGKAAGAWRCLETGMSYSCSCACNLVYFRAYPEVAVYARIRVLTSRGFDLRMCSHIRIERKCCFSSFPNTPSRMTTRFVFGMKTRLSLSTYFFTLTLLCVFY